jgi:hypothetical protein
VASRRRTAHQGGPLAVAYARWYPEHFLDGALYREDTSAPLVVFRVLERIDPGNVWHYKGVTGYLIPNCPHLLAGFPVRQLPQGVDPRDATTSFVIPAGSSERTRRRIVTMAAQ